MRAIYLGWDTWDRVTVLRLGDKVARDSYVLENLDETPSSPWRLAFPSTPPGQRRLAEVLLHDVTGDFAVSARFAFTFVMERLSKLKGPIWQITEEEIRDWLATFAVEDTTRKEKCR